MPEFVIHDSIWDKDLTIVSENRYASNMALLRYLTNRGFQICVLKYGFLKQQYIVIGGQDCFSAWLEEEYEKADPYYKPEVEYVSSLEDEAVSRWANDIMPKEVWTYYISHEFYDEFNRSGPTLCSYSVCLRHFTTVSPEQENDPSLKEFREAGYLSASVKKEEPV